jgi:hypothetical protein
VTSYSFVNVELHETTLKMADETRFTTKGKPISSKISVLMQALIMFKAKIL